MLAAYAGSLFVADLGPLLVVRTHLLAILVESLAQELFPLDLLFEALLAHLHEFYFLLQHLEMAELLGRAAAERRTGGFDVHAAASVATRTRVVAFDFWEGSLAFAEHRMAALVRDDGAEGNSDHTEDRYDARRLVDAKYAAEKLSEDWLKQVRVHARDRRVELHAEDVADRAKERCEETEEEDRSEGDVSAEPAK